MAYVTKSDVKDWLGISGTTYDTSITQATVFLSELADEWTGRNFPDLTLGSGFNTHSVTETFYLLDGDDGVLLREWPVSSIISLKDDGDTITSGKYHLFGDRGWLQFIDDSDSLPVQRFGLIEVSYVGGFSSVPAGLKYFIYRGTDYLLQKRMREGIGAELMGDMQTTFRSPDNELRGIFRETAAQYQVDIFENLDGEIF